MADDRVRGDGADDRRWRGDAALAALGGLTPAEVAAVESVAESDPSRRRELAELRRVAAALASADDPDVDAVRAPSAIPDRVLDAVGADRRRRRARIAASVAGAAAAALILVVVLVVAGGGGQNRVAFGEAPPGVTATFALVANDSGTAVDLEIDGLTDGPYWLWLTDASGVRTSAGTFRAGTGDTNLVLQAALPLEATRRVWVTDVADAVVLDAVLDDDVVVDY